MDRTDLLGAITRSIGALEPVYRTSASEDDLYEAALLAIAVRAAKSADGTPLLTNDGISQAPQLCFRRSPGNLWSGSFSYALVTFPNTTKRLEIHLGVKVLSRNKVAHECDIALLDYKEAERSRRGAVHPRNSGLIAAIEAKNYATSPDLGIGRGFLGLASELGQDRCSLAFPGVSSSSVAALIARRPSEAFDDLVPNGPAARRLLSHLDQRIRNWRSKR